MPDTVAESMSMCAAASLLVRRLMRLCADWYLYMVPVRIYTWPRGAPLLGPGLRSGVFSANAPAPDESSADSCPCPMMLPPACAGRCCPLRGLAGAAGLPMPRRLTHRCSYQLRGAIRGLKPQHSPCECCRSCRRDRRPVPATCAAGGITSRASTGRSFHCVLLRAAKVSVPSGRTLCRGLAARLEPAARFVRPPPTGRQL